VHHALEEGLVLPVDDDLDADAGDPLDDAGPLHRDALCPG